MSRTRSFTRSLFRWVFVALILGGGTVLVWEVLCSRPRLPMVASGDIRVDSDLTARLSEPVSVRLVTVASLRVTPAQYLPAFGVDEALAGVKDLPGTKEVRVMMWERTCLSRVREQAVALSDPQNGIVVYWSSRHLVGWGR